MEIQQLHTHPDLRRQDSHGSKPCRLAQPLRDPCPAPKPTRSDTASTPHTQTPPQANVHNHNEPAPRLPMHRCRPRDRLDASPQPHPHRHRSQQPCANRPSRPSTAPQHQARADHKPAKPPEHRVPPHKDPVKAHNLPQHQAEHLKSPKTDCKEAATTAAQIRPPSTQAWSEPAEAPSTAT